MREFEFTFDNGFKVGLRKHHKNPRNSQALVEAHNMAVTPYGMEPTYNLTNVLGLEVNEWPFPQLVCGSNYTYLITRDIARRSYRFYSVALGGTLTFLLEIDDQTFTKGDKQFDVVDVGPYLILTNGKVIVRRDPVTGVLNGFLSRTGLPRTKTLCNFKGQLIGGNVQSSWYSCGESNIIWGAIGSEDFTPGQSNIAGFSRLPLGGTVYATRRLGDVVMVYGSKELAALVPARDPAPTFKLDEMLDTGIVSDGAVGGSLTEHIFIDKSGWLWRLDSNLKLTKLGYQEWMTLLDPSKIIISYDESDRRYFIGDGTISYLLTESGLSTTHQSFTGIGLWDGERQAVAASSGDQEFRLETDTLDFGYRGLKTLFTAEVGIESVHSAEFCYDFKTNRKKEWAKTRWSPLNEQGWGTQIISVNDFRAKLRVSSGSGTTVDYMKFRWKMTDLRSIRGVYAAPARGQGIQVDQ